MYAKFVIHDANTDNPRYAPPRSVIFEGKKFAYQEIRLADIDYKKNPDIETAVKCADTVTAHCDLDDAVILLTVYGEEIERYLASWKFAQLYIMNDAGDTIDVVSKW